MNKRSRLKLTLIAGLFLSLLATYATYSQMETVAITCIGAMMTILSTYIWAQTKRPSFNISVEQENDVNEHPGQQTTGTKTLRIKTTVLPDGRQVKNDEGSQSIEK